MHVYRTHNCGALSHADIGQTVKLGWVNHKRDHGGVVFIDLRDHYGLTQWWSIAPIVPLLRKNSFMWIGYHHHRRGACRSEDTVNKALSTGKIEIQMARLSCICTDITLAGKFGRFRRGSASALSLSGFAPPAPARQYHAAPKSSSLSASAWSLLALQNFKPYFDRLLARRARDFLVPADCIRANFMPRHKPQQFKQLIMVSGFDKYFQIAPVSEMKIAVQIEAANFTSLIWR